MELNIKQLIIEIDCTQEYDKKLYIEHGDVLVKESVAGRYREAEAKPLSRFGYRFNIEHIGKPHVAIIRYPDDKRRYMCTMDGTSYDLTTGVFTGFAQPLSGQMLEIQNIFWPRWQDCSIMFMTWGHGEPAAVESIRIYELEDLPELVVPGDPCNGTRRSFGIQYEDPCGTGGSEGAMGREEWLERVITYCRFTGQKLLAYPINWYHGPQYPSSLEPCDSMESVILADRRMYSHWTTNPADWLGRLLKRFSEEGLEFQAVLTLLRLGSLMQKMNTNIDSIVKGEDTINNMLWNNNVQAGTQDWTLLYNARNFTKVVELCETGKDVYEVTQEEFPYIYGEETGKCYHAAPIFNPIHPVVQETVIKYIEEIVGKYGSYPAFKGISFNMWHATFLWFGSIHSGYDDYTAALFEKETHIRIPADKNDSDRFSKRYEFLTYICRPAWVEWRCKKIHQLLCRIRDAVIKIKPGLRITFTLWTETTAPLSLGRIDAARQLYSRLDNYQFYREAGIDMKLFQNEPCIDIDIQLEAQRDRGGWGTDGANAPIEKATMFRDFDFLDRTTQGAIKSLSNSGVFIFNGWVEAWGKHMWYKCGPDDNITDNKLALMNGKPVEGIFRANSIYPRDNFWWDSQSRITPGFQGGVHFMEHYAHAVAEFDACKITRGGLFLDKAHSEQIQKFALAYRALPDKKFETVGESTDPVAVRTLLYEDKRYFYLVNREYYPVAVKLSFSGAPVEIVDIAGSEPFTASEQWDIMLEPYQLRSFTVGADVQVNSFMVSVAEDIVVELNSEVGKALSNIKNACNSGFELPGMDRMEEDMVLALKAGHFAWLRRALGSYIVRKCSELVDAADR